MTTKKRKQRVSKYSKLIERCYQMEPGDWEEYAVPPGKGVQKFRDSVARALDRYVRAEFPAYLFLVRKTVRRTVRIECHKRGKR